MGLISKDHLGLAIQAIKLMIGKIEARLLSKDDAIAMSMELGLVTPLADDTGVIYTDGSGYIYIL